MFTLFFVLILFKNVLTDDYEVNEKYIDLLSEEEKQELLNRIARRILEGINSNRTPSTPNESHADITDDQLDAHDAFVREILKEESDNLKNKDRRLNNENLDAVDRFIPDHVESNENFGYKLESNVGDKEKHIDLTLREGISPTQINGDSVTEVNITDNPYDEIPVKTVYETEYDIKMNNESLIIPSENNTMKSLQMHDAERALDSNNAHEKNSTNDLGYLSNLKMDNNYDDIPVKIVYEQKYDDVQIKNVSLVTFDENNTTGAKRVISSNNNIEVVTANDLRNLRDLTNNNNIFIAPVNTVSKQENANESFNKVTLATFHENITVQSERESNTDDDIKIVYVNDVGNSSSWLKDNNDGVLRVQPVLQQENDYGIMNNKSLAKFDESIVNEAEGESNSNNKQETMILNKLGNSSKFILFNNGLLNDTLNGNKKIDNSRNIKNEYITKSELRNAGNVLLPNINILSDSQDKYSKIENAENLRKNFNIELILGTTKITDFEPIDEKCNNTQYCDVNDATTPFPTILLEETTDSINSEDISTQKIYESIDKWEDDVKETTEEYQSTTNNDNSQTESPNVTNVEVTESIENENKRLNVTDSYLFNTTNKVFRRLPHFSERIDESVILEHLHTTEPHLHIIPIDDMVSTSFDKPLTESTTNTPIESRTVINFRESLKSISKSNNTQESRTHRNVLSIKQKIETDKTQNNLENQNRMLSNIKKRKNNYDETVLRVTSDDLDSSQIDENEPLHNVANNPDKTKVYEVYEVDASQPHFVSTDEAKQNEHALYVPVYNYGPENAYFKPYNKYGPNIDDFKNQNDPESTMIENIDQNKLFNARNRFAGYSDNKKRGSYEKVQRNIIQSYNTISNNMQKAKFFDFIKPVQNQINQNIIYNPNDYGDLDYYLSRILRRNKRYQKNMRQSIYNEKQRGNKKSDPKVFPNSNEPDHPISSIHNSDTIKDHVRAIRNIFYLHNQFGYVPKTEENVARKVNRYQTTKKNKSKKPKEYNIAFDYYFDRADVDEDPIDIQNPTYRENKSKKNKLEIVPLTPNPLDFEDNLDNIEEKQDLHKDISSITDVPLKKMITVLKDAMQVGDENLVKYDWLKTTVNIQAALRKLLDLITQLKDGEYIHPKDIELIKYTIYIFKASKLKLHEVWRRKDLDELNIKRVMGKTSVQKMPRPKRLMKIKEPIKLWMSFATFLRSDEIEEDSTEYKLINDFEKLLRGLLLNLEELHDAIKHISMMTQYKNQNWYHDLTDLYLKKGFEKNLAQVILHLSLSKLLDSIEDSSIHGAEDNFRLYVKKNRDVVEKSKEECLFVLKVLDELSRMNVSEHLT